MGVPASAGFRQPSEQEDNKIRYHASPTLRRFHASNAFVRAIKGPIGSGKSAGCCMEIQSRAKEQVAYQGFRRSRWAIVRNTYPELRDTTIKTWKDWVPEEICKVSQAPPFIGRMQLDPGDGIIVDLEINFLALDKEDDVRKLKSLELTGVWLNEVSEIPKAAFDMACGRVDRYPAKARGGTAWTGVIMDTNPPDNESWYHELAEEKKPKGFEFFHQPPAILPIKKKNKEDPQLYTPNRGQGIYEHAENIEHLNSGFEYYMRQVPGKSLEWIKVFLMGQYGSVFAGKPVYPEYIDDIHCAKEDLAAYGGLPLIIGFDFGLTPCCVFCQITPRGQLLVIDELTSDGEGIRSFANNTVKPYLINVYGGMRFNGVGDPSGKARAQSDETTCLQELAEAGIPTEMAPTNAFIPRREAVAGYMNRMTEGKPGFMLSPRCKTLRKGFQGKYRYRRIRGATGERNSDVPEKLHPWSDVQDALQYAALSAENLMQHAHNNSFTGGNSQAREIVTKSGKGWT